MALPQEEEDRQSLVAILSVYRVPIILAAASILLILFSVFLIVKQYQSASPIEFSSASLESTASGQQGLMVDIAGGVSRPGVYRVPVGSRVEDAIVAAGGFSFEADIERIAKIINRAAILSDGAKLYIPKKGEATALSGTSDSGIVSGVSTTASVSVNAASQSELETLSGIGPATAIKIINGRPYTSLEELVSRKILFQSTFNKLKDQLTL